MPIALGQTSIEVTFDIIKASFDKDEVGQCTLTLGYKIAGETKEIIFSGLELNSFISEFSRANIIYQLLDIEGYPPILQAEAESLFLNN